MSEASEIIHAQEQAEAFRLLFEERAYIMLQDYAVPDTRPAWKRRLSQARRTAAYRAAEWLER